MFEEAMECFHELDDRDVWTGVDELMIRLGSISPAPRVREGVKLPGLLARSAREKGRCNRRSS
jgi:hypothetical protein